MAHPDFLMHNACAFPLYQWIPGYAWPVFNKLVGAKGIMPTGPEMGILNLLGVAMVAVSAHSSWAGETKSKIINSDPFMTKVIKGHTNRYLYPMGESLNQIAKVSGIRAKIKGNEAKLPTVVFADHTSSEKIDSVRSRLGRLSVQPTPELARVWDISPTQIPFELNNRGFAVCYDTSQSWDPKDGMGLDLIQSCLPYIEEVHIRVSPDYASRLEKPKEDYDQLISGILISGSKLDQQVGLLKQAENLHRVVVEVPAVSHLVYGGKAKLLNSVRTYRDIVTSLRNWFS